MDATQAHVTHKFTQNKRLLLFLVLSKSDNFVNRRIHSRVHVHCVGIDVSFVMNGSAIIISLDMLVHGHKVASHEGFVAQTPNDDGRV